MSTSFAALETRVGQVAAARLADATLTAGALSVDGILDEAVGVELDMRSRRIRFVAPDGTAADDHLEEGDAVTVTKNAVAVNYVVGVAPVLGGGQCVIDLKLAA
jgi:hypothetical protein